MRLKSALKLLIGGALVGAFALLSYEILYWATHVYDSGARIRTELTRISSPVNGTIARIAVTEGSRVKKGAPLFSLVDDDIEAAIAALQVDLTLERAGQARLVAEKRAFETELESRLATGRERIRAIEQDYKAALDRLKLAEKNLSRADFLFRKNLTSEEKLSVEKDKVLVLQGQLDSMLAGIDVARRELEQVAATGRQIEIFEEKIRISELTLTRIESMITIQQVALRDRHVTSPIDAIIDRVYKHRGEFVEDGDEVLILHDPDIFWIEAFVDEDRIRHVRVGQAVRIDLETHPFQEFFGTVTRIGSVTTEEMGIADTGESGRFGSAVQHVPVRISLDSPPPHLAPGMLANVNIRIHDRFRLW